MDKIVSTIRFQLNIYNPSNVLFYQTLPYLTIKRNFIVTQQFKYRFIEFPFFNQLLIKYF